jgi:hypothetical protein
LPFLRRFVLSRCQIFQVVCHERVSFSSAKSASRLQRRLENITLFIFSQLERF